VGTLNRITQAYQRQVDFYVIYIREIHPTDGWQVRENEQEGVLFPQHRSFAERVAVGQTCMQKTGLRAVALVDEMDDAVSLAYNGMPERLYLIGRDGRVAYKGGLGPMFFHPEEWERAIAGYLDADVAVPLVVEEESGG
jgi:hypothetical protein